MTTTEEHPGVEMARAMYDIANDLTYPMDEEGNQANLHFLIPMLSSHLAKCGYRKHPEKAVIIQQPVPGAAEGKVAGVPHDAVRWVRPDARGEIPECFKKQAEDMKDVTTEQPNTEGWTVKPHITLNGETIRGGN